MRQILAREETLEDVAGEFSLVLLQGGFDIRGGIPGVNNLTALLLLLLFGALSRGVRGLGAVGLPRGAYLYRSVCLTCLVCGRRLVGSRVSGFARSLGLICCLGRGFIDHLRRRCLFALTGRGQSLRISEREPAPAPDAQGTHLPVMRRQKRHQGKEDQGSSFQFIRHFV